MCAIEQPLQRAIAAEESPCGLINRLALHYLPHVFDHLQDTTLSHHTPVVVRVTVGQAGSISMAMAAFEMAVGCRRHFGLASFLCVSPATSCGLRDQCHQAKESCNPHGCLLTPAVATGRPSAYAKKVVKVTRATCRCETSRVGAQVFDLRAAPTLRWPSSMYLSFCELRRIKILILLTWILNPRRSFST